MKAIISLAAAVAAIASMGTSHAAVEIIQNSNTATSICQGALPVFETNLRKRPLGVSNEGSQDSFISCSFTTSADGNQGVNIVRYFGGFFTNYTSTDVTVTCTGVQGFQGREPTVYESQSVVVLANGAPGTPDTGYIFFGPGVGEDPYYQNVSMSCALPPGVSLNDTYVGYDLDDATA